MPEEKLLHDPEGLRYSVSLAHGLRDEVVSHPGAVGNATSLLLDIDRLLAALEAASRGFSFRRWQDLWREYRALACRKAALLNEAATVSRVYKDMDSFWADADAQARGESPFTFWDTYEHGRRRQLESLLAATYGSEAAVLVNSGMSAIAVALGAQTLRSGDVVITGERCYFETSDYFQSFLEKTGVEVVRLPLHETEAVLEGLRRLRPRVFLFETVTNASDVTVPRGVRTWFEAHPEVLFIIDNSVQSHLTRWFELQTRESTNLLVVESAVKYITQECMAGVVYGSKDAIETVRHYARSTGQQLQEKAFSYMGEAEIRSLDQRLALHARNTAAFRRELEADPDAWEFVRTLDATAGGEGKGGELFTRGIGALVFVALSTSDNLSPDWRHRGLIAAWQERARDSGVPLPVRAGFGWTQTAGRVYESAKLNQADSPSYLRISVGIEPDPVVRGLARALSAAAGKPEDEARALKGEAYVRF